MFVTAQEEASLFVLFDSQLYVPYTVAKKRAFAKTLQMERVITPFFSVFVGHGHLQHARAEWEKSPRLGHHAYSILSQVSLQEAISISDGASLYIQPSTTFFQNHTYEPLTTQYIT